MGIGETTILFYLLIGAGVAVAVWLGEEPRGAAELAFRIVSAVLFWPMYLPLLLNRPPDTVGEDLYSAANTKPADGMSAAISQVEEELDAALRSLDGWAEASLSHEQQRLGELQAAWRLQAQRVRELDRLLDQPEFGVDVATARKVESQENAPPLGKGGTKGGSLRDPESFAGQPHHSERIQHSEQARCENIRRLREVRRQLHDDLMGTLAWVRELVTMIHLAKFTGAPPSRAEELVAQIAASVEGLSEVTHWQEETEPVVTV